MNRPESQVRPVQSWPSRVGKKANAGLLPRGWLWESESFSGTSAGEDPEPDLIVVGAAGIATEAGKDEAVGLSSLHENRVALPNKRVRAGAPTGFNSPMDLASS